MDSRQDERMEEGIEEQPAASIEVKGEEASRSPADPPKEKADNRNPAAGKYPLYQAWPGENRFCCLGTGISGGPGSTFRSSEVVRACCAKKKGSAGQNAVGEQLARCVEACEPLEHPVCLEYHPANLCAWCCILVPSALYYIYAAPYLWTEVHPLLPLFTVFLFFVTVTCLLLACCTDPGILPRREVILATGTRERLKEQMGYDLLGQYGEAEVPKGSTYWDAQQAAVPPEMRSKGYRLCSTCKIVRPPRASHCPDCDNCVLTFDHHCPFVNNCVGQRNYVYFISFTSSVCCLALFVLPCLVWVALQSVGPRNKNTSDEESSEDILKGALIAAACAAGVVALGVLLLWAYHVYLICTGQTTKEHWKGKRHTAANQKELSIFTFRGPRLFNPRALVEATPVAEPVRYDRRRRLEVVADSFPHALPPSLV